MDDVFRKCLRGVDIRTSHGGLAPRADCNFTSFWLCLSEMIADSRVTAYKTCGLPIIASGERGTKRLYCNDTCKRKYKRALRFASLVNNEGIETKEAAKQSSIAVKTATRILERNGIRARHQDAREGDS